MIFDRIIPSFLKIGFFMDTNNANLGIPSTSSIGDSADNKTSHLSKLIQFFRAYKQDLMIESKTLDSINSATPPH